jgi:RNA polymerase sigma-70 factor (ECF subfamily)
MGEVNYRNKLKELEIVITEYQDQLFRFAFFRTGSFADSQDIVQDLFIKLYKENGHLDAVNNIRFYLFRSISNACIDYHRKNKKNKFETIDTANIPAELHAKEASHELLRIEEYRRTEMLLSELPDEQAETIRLRVLDSLSFAEIAEILEVPVTTVKSRFKYGIDKLKLKLEKLKEVTNGL